MRHSNFILRSQSGMTLIEIVVAMVLMAFISIFTAQSIQDAIKTRKKMDRTIERTGTLRGALEVMSRDINMAFSYYDYSVDVYNQAWQERIKKAEDLEKAPPAPAPGPSPGSPPPAPTPPAAPTPPGGVAAKRSEILKAKFKPKAQKYITNFIGEAEQIHFTSLNHIRMVQGLPQSDQMEVGYYLKPCKARLDKKKDSTTCLWRRVSPYLDELTNEGGEEAPLLENVDKFVLRYLGPGFDGEWTDTWKSTSDTVDDRMRGNFPYAVEITLGVKEKADDKDKGLTMTVVAALKFPNNKKQEPTTPGVPGAPASPLPPPAGN